MPEYYNQNRRYELSLKVLGVGDDVDESFDEMQQQNHLKEIDPTMPEDYKVAKYGVLLITWRNMENSY